MAILLLAFSGNILFAQELRSLNQHASGSNPATPHTRMGPLISLSAAASNSQSDLPGNGKSIQADAFVPFYQKTGAMMPLRLA
ncbi:hypothetical protein [Niabella aquatica]